MYWEIFPPLMFLTVNCDKQIKLASIRSQLAYYLQ